MGKADRQNTSNADYDRNRDAGAGRFYALNARGNCPPALMKKGNGCQLPGTAKKMYKVGQRYNQDLGSNWHYSELPSQLRSQHALDQNAQYYYNDGYFY